MTQPQDSGDADWPLQVIPLDDDYWPAARVRRPVSLTLPDADKCKDFERTSQG